MVGTALYPIPGSQYYTRSLGGDPGVNRILLNKPRWQAHPTPPDPGPPIVSPAVEVAEVTILI